MQAAAQHPRFQIQSEVKDGMTLHYFEPNPFTLYGTAVEGIEGLEPEQLQADFPRLVEATEAIESWIAEYKTGQCSKRDIAQRLAQYADLGADDTASREAVLVAIES